MTESTAQFRFVPDSCGHVLKDRYLAVPVYQRSFSWTTEQISEFWDDVRLSVTHPTSEYFLGTVVLSASGSDSAHTIIDGQQRLATTAILLAAIRNELRTRGDSKRADIIQNSYLSVQDLSSGEAKPRLRLNSVDDPFFRAIVIDGKDPADIPPTSESHGLIADALKKMEEFVWETAESLGKEWTRRLLDWVAFLTDRLRIIVVDVPTEADAFLIFETLNDRGADLTIADLLKNYLFGRAEESLNVVRDGWMAALGALDMSAENSLFTTFLRHFWSSKYGATRERLLFKSIKQHVTNETQAVKFAEELRAAARLYAAILNSDHDFWADLGTGSKKNVETLQRLGLEQNRPLLLAAMQHFTKPELKKTLRGLVSWSVRGLLVGGIGAGKTERYYSQAAVKIRAGEIKGTDELLAELSEVVPSDEEFEAAFAVARVTNARLARYFLLTLERARMNEAEPELVPNADEDEVNLEHILPKNARQSDWPEFHEEERKVWVHRLGNMALLKRGPNGRIGNRPWGSKRPVLGASELRLTKATADSDTWDKSTIEDRQRDLATLAREAWPRGS